MEKMKTKRKINKVNLWATIISFVVVLGIIGLVSGLIMMFVLLQDRPELNLSDFNQTESSVIYDQNNDIIANLGDVIRTNIEYEELPNCVIDAFVAVEDSRFFEHNGFDLPRMAKSAIVNIFAGEFAQGGSTFTMQLIKNTYFVNDETGEEASRSGMSAIQRKVQEIALAMQLEGQKSKQDIFESYVNKLNYGADFNIRGIEKAAQYYFGKNVKNLNINEGALLAGVINAPNYYNPFHNLEEAQSRMEQVLYLMNYHGYISDTEYEIATSVNVEDLLHDPYENYENGQGIPYQAYIDVVTSEVYKLTGLDPYSTTMNIYTYMNKDIQNQMDAIQAGNMDDYLEYPDDYLEVASVCINNSTGQVVGVMGGRNYANGGQLLLNHATDQYRQPGSTIKPILDYALAFENLGWATDHVMEDKPMYMDSSHSTLVYNNNGRYLGDVTLKEAVGESINTIAIQTLQQVLDAKKYDYVVDYCQSIGYNFSIEDFNIQYAVGASYCEVTPMQQAAALAMIMNYGVYNTPHTISKIEFANGKSPITPVYKPVQVLSDAAAFLTSELLYSNVENYGGSYNYVNDEYPVYAKTGTTDYDGKTARKLGVPSGAIKDGWLIAATSEYSVSSWVGYEKVVSGQPSYITDSYYQNQRPQAKIADLILDATVTYGNSEPIKLTKPSSVTSITHIIGTWPYAGVIDGMDENLITTGYIKKDSAKLVNLEAPTIENLTGEPSASLDNSNGILIINWPKYPDESKLQVISNVKDNSLKDSSGGVIVPSEGKCLFDYSWIYGPIRYIADIEINDNGTIETKTVVSETDKFNTILSLNPGCTVNVTVYYGYEKGQVTSDKKTISITSETIFSVPGSGSLDTIQNWAANYYFIDFVIQETSDSSLINTYKVVSNKTGQIITPGKSVTVKDNETFTCTFYVSKAVSMTLYKTTISNNIKITASLSIEDGNIAWSVPVSYQVNDANSILISKDDIPDSGITVRASSNNASAELLVTK